MLNYFWKDIEKGVRVINEECFVEVYELYFSYVM